MVKIPIANQSYPNLRGILLRPISSVPNSYEKIFFTKLLKKAEKGMHGNAMERKYTLPLTCPRRRFFLGVVSILSVTNSYKREKEKVKRQIIFFGKKITVLKKLP